MNVEDANKRLPLVRAVVRDIMDRWKELLAVRSKLADLGRTPVGGERREALQADAERIEDELRRHVQELEEIGAELKDPSLGLVDFEAQVGSRSVYLCWKADEREIRWWHEKDAGFAGRRPIEELR